MTDPGQRKRELALAGLLAVSGDYALVPTEPVASSRDKLAALSAGDLFGERRIIDRDMADCCLAGLWLRFDFLDRSHTISQGIDTPSGSYWHGIMHRREPDWSNAKYWFHKVGRHEVFDDLLATAGRIAGDLNLDADAKSLVGASSWDPFAFVDLCQHAHNDGGELESFCRAVQVAEWELLFDWCYRSAIGQ